MQISRAGWAPRRHYAREAGAMPLATSCACGRTESRETPRPGPIRAQRPRAREDPCSPYPGGASPMAFEEVLRACVGPACDQGDFPHSS